MNLKCNNEYDENSPLFVSTTEHINLNFVFLQIPIMHKFSKSKTIFSIFGVISIVFVIIAATPAGFPYKPDVAAQRFYVLVCQYNHKKNVKYL